MSCTPSVRANHLVFCDVTSSHVPCLTHSAIHQTITSQTLAVVVQTFASCRTNIHRNIQRNLTHFIFHHIIQNFFFFVFFRFPSVAIPTAKNIRIPLHAIRLQLFAIFLNHVFVVVVAIPTCSTFRNITRQRWTIVIWQRSFTTRFHVLSNRHSNHLINRILLRGVATNNFTIFLDGCPT